MESGSTGKFEGLRSNKEIFRCHPDKMSHLLIRGQVSPGEQDKDSEDRCLRVNRPVFYCEALFSFLPILLKTWVRSSGCGSVGAETGQTCLNLRNVGVSAPVEEEI